MQSLTPVPPDLARAIDASPVYSTHDHIRPLGMVRPLGLARLLLHTYVVWSLRVADGSPNGASENDLELTLTDDRWESTAEAVRRVRFTSYYRWLMRGLADLYDLPDHELTERSWKVLVREIPRRSADDGWIGTVLDRAKVKVCIWDPFWRAGTAETPDARFRPSFRINSSLVAYHPDASDFESSNLIRDWSASFGMDVSSLSDLEALIDRVLAMNLAAGCRSLKSAIAYERTLSVGPASRAEAERIFGTRPDRISARDRLTFGDYVLRFLLDRARDHRLVVQIHTGLARLDASQPLKLDTLLQQYPDIVFDLFHGGYPWIRESAALAHQYPNVRLNLTWLPQLSSEAAVDALKEWLQVVPQVDRITWGGDSQTVEETYGTVLAAKHVVGRALAELIADGYLDEEAAIVAARSVLYDAGVAIYGAEPPASGHL